MNLSELKTQLEAILQGFHTIGLDPEKIPIKMRVTTDDSLEITSVTYDHTKKTLYLKAGI